MARMTTSDETPVNHLEEALEQLGYAEGAIERLAMLYKIESSRRPEQHVAAAHEDKRNGMTLAKIHVLLEIADQLATLNAILATSTKPLGRSAVERGRDIESDRAAFRRSDGGYL